MVGPRRPGQDGRTSPAYDGVSEVTLSEDGSSLIYVVKRNKRASVVFNGEYGPEYDAVDSLALIANGKQYGVDLPVLSVDGKQYGYRVNQGGKAFAVINGAREPVFDSISGITFSPSGSSAAYEAKLGNRCFVVSGGRRGPEFDDVRGIEFSADGKQIGYVARIGRELWWKVLDLD